MVLLWGGSFAAIKHLLGAGLTGPGHRGRPLPGGRARVRARACTCRAASAGSHDVDLVRLAAAGMMVVFTYHLALNVGERYTSSGTAAVIVGTAPGMHAWRWRARSGWSGSRARAAVGLAIAFAGVVVVVLLGSGQEVSFDNAKGPLIVLGAPLAFALFNVITKPLLSRHSPIGVSAAASLIGTVALLPLTSHDVLSTRAVAGRLGLDADPVPRAGLHAVRVHRVDGRARPSGPLPRGRLHLLRSGVRGDRRRGRAGRADHRLAAARRAAGGRRGGPRAVRVRRSLPRAVPVPAGKLSTWARGTQRGRRPRRPRPRASAATTWRRASSRETRRAVWGSTADNPTQHFIGWADEVDAEQLFTSGAAWGSRSSASEPVRPAERSRPSDTAQRSPTGPTARRRGRC